jgi:hypothetical protein
MRAAYLAAAASLLLWSCDGAGFDEDTGRAEDFPDEVSSTSFALESSVDMQVQNYNGVPLPAAGNAGRLAYRTGDGDNRGLWVDSGSSWYGVAGEQYNVKAYGAKGDGVTNDLAAIQQAVDNAAASPSGGVVYLPPGDYLIGSSLTLPRANGSLRPLVIRGAGTTVTRIKTPTWIPESRPTIEFEAVGNATPTHYVFEDFEVLRQNDGRIFHHDQPSGPIAGMMWERLRYAALRNLRFTSTYSGPSQYALCEIDGAQFVLSQAGRAGGQRAARGGGGADRHGGERQRQHAVGPRPRRVPARRPDDDRAAELRARGAGGRVHHDRHGHVP